ncbi:MAG: hypothetical protein MUO76_07760 [Anaerolineaceae bacterium]|nr:hypothetical protein [Anaerolineaceae bacterium]
MITQIEEILDLYETDGFFIDIVVMRDCVCNNCWSDTGELGYDPTVPAERRRFDLFAERRFMERNTSAIQVRRSEVSIFYNNRVERGMLSSLEHGIRAEIGNFTHFEIGSLPGIMWVMITSRFMRAINSLWGSNLLA